MPLQTQFEVSTANEVVGTIVSSSESSIEPDDSQTADQTSSLSLLTLCGRVH
jgi:hypothetical protein